MTPQQSHVPQWQRQAGVYVFVTAVVSLCSTVNCQKKVQAAHQMVYGNLEDFQVWLCDSDSAALAAAITVALNREQKHLYGFVNTVKHLCADQ